MLKIEAYFALSDDCVQLVFSQLLFISGMEDGGVDITVTQSRMGHYFFSYSLTWKVDPIEFLDIMPQMWQYVIFLSLKPTKVTSDFLLY